MTDLFNIKKEDLENPEKVKILDGIAGSAKSTAIAAALDGVEYLRTTSTNRLRRDAFERFGGEVDTIAGGLFQTGTDGRFYETEKEPDIKTIVIDEILQTSPRVFEWIEHHRGLYNIIVCTDSMQMLTPVGASRMLEDFKKLCGEPWAIVNNLTKSLRPIDQETADLYAWAYTHVEDEGVNIWREISSRLKRVKFDAVKYSTADAFLCHTNATEREIYDRYHLRDRYEIDLIPKGTIGRKEVKDPHKYPILPQAEVSRVFPGYYQTANVGSVMRYQGSEVYPGETLFYFVEKGAKIGNREAYTMLTRAKSVQSIAVVEVYTRHDYKLETWQGKPILVPQIYRGDGTEVGKAIEEAEDKEKETGRQLLKLNQKSGVYFSGVLSGGKVYKPYKKNTDRTKVNIRTLLNKMPAIRDAFPGALYHTIEKNAPGVFQVLTPMNVDFLQEEQEAGNMLFDLYSAYPSAAARVDMPDGQTFTANRHSDIDIYIITGGQYGKPGTLITGGLYDELKGWPGFCAVFIGGYKKTERTEEWQKLRAMAYDTKETKAKAKTPHWGIMQRAYVSPIKYDEHGEPQAYTVQDDARYIVPIVCIQSEVARVMVRVKKATTGTPMGGFTKIDGCFFPYYIEPNEPEWNEFNVGEKLFKRLKEAADGYDFRLYWLREGAENVEIFKTYKDLLTKEEKKKEQHRKHMQEKRKEGRAAA